MPTGTMAIADGGTEGSAAERSPAAVASAAKSLLEFITTAGSLTAVLSALMFYFGYIRTQVFYDHFGVPVEALHFTTSDYLLRSRDVFFKPVIWATLGLAVFCGLIYGCRKAETAKNAKLRIAVRGLLAVMTVIGAAVAMLGLSSVVPAKSAAVALALSGALILVQYDMYRLGPARKPPIAVAAVGALLATAAAFWWTSIYAEDVGLKSAQSVVGSIHGLERAWIYSLNDLPLKGGSPPGFITQQGSWRLYNGYRILTYANDRWYLISDAWTPDTPTVILPGDDNTIQVKVGPAG